jgi:dTDP-4-dehydrorhamnose 3,5-epimerase
MTKRFEFTDTPLGGVKLVHLNPLADSRGYLERLFSVDELAPLLEGKQIVQINHTMTSKRGTVRGMHFQRPPHAEDKLIHCIRGRVFDVAVDLRSHSPTFLSWHAEILDPLEHNMLFIPAGFAHGFQTLAADSEMLYLHTAAHHPAAEDGINPNDPLVKIDWPLEFAEISERDSLRPVLTAEFSGLSV